MSAVYVVTQGEYSDYRIVAVFDDEAAANRIRDRINAGSPYAYAGVETYPVRGADFRPGRWVGRWSSVSRLTADVASTRDCAEDDIEGAHTGKSQTRVTESFTAPDHHEVYTHGDAERVPQAHADAVAKLRAEVLGL